MENRNKRSKRLIAILLIVALLLTGGTAFAYWQGLFNDTKTEVGTVNVGVGGDYVLVVDVKEALEGKKLVPLGKVPYSIGGAAGNTDSLTIKYTVKITTDLVDIKVSDLLVEVTNKSHDLLNVKTTFADKTINSNEPVEVTFTITLNAPVDKAGYDQVAGSPFTFTIVFTVKPTPTVTSTP